MRRAAPPVLRNGLIGALAPEAFGIWKLPFEGGEGAKYAAFENMLMEAVDAWAPARIILEAPFSFQAMLGVSTERVMKQQYTLRGIAYAEAWRAGCSIQEIDACTARSEVLGRGSFSKDQVRPRGAGDAE
jgi:hypothetical protein